MGTESIIIQNKKIGENEPCFIIAEAGINHNGDIKIAQNLIKNAKKNGADAIKFQTHIPEHEMINGTPTADYIGESLFALLKRVELSEKQHKHLKEYSDKQGIIFLSTPFSIQAVDWLERIHVPAYKIGSGEMTNHPLLEYVAKKNKPLILSTGMSTVKEIEESVCFVSKFNKKIILLQCTSTYPAKYENVNLNFMKKLKNKFKVPVGLSDHTPGIYTSLAAVALGACVIEKHFTIDRSLPGPDQKASIIPEELKELVKGARAIEKSLGSSKKITDDEIPIMRMARESVVSLQDIPKKTYIKKEMVWVKRPGTGIPAKHLHEVIGRKTKHDIPKNSVVQWSDIE